MVQGYQLDWFHGLQNALDDKSSIVGYSSGQVDKVTEQTNTRVINKLVILIQNNYKI